jgi:hypothetical protein
VLGSFTAELSFYLADDFSLFTVYTNIMQIVKFVAMALLFALLTPGVIIWLPTGASRKVAAVIHGLVFALVWYLATEFFEIVEGFADAEKDKKKK